MLTLGLLYKSAEEESEKERKKKERELIIPAAALSGGVSGVAHGAYSGNSKKLNEIIHNEALSMLGTPGVNEEELNKIIESTQQASGVSSRLKNAAIGGISGAALGSAVGYMSKKFREEEDKGAGIREAIPSYVKTYGALGASILGGLGLGTGIRATHKPMGYRVAAPLVGLAAGGLVGGFYGLVDGSILGATESGLKYSRKKKEEERKRAGLTKTSEHNNDDERNELTGMVSGAVGGLFGQQVSKAIDTEHAKRFYQGEGFSEEEAKEFAKAYVKGRTFWETPLTSNKRFMIGAGIASGYGTSRITSRKRNKKKERSEEMDDFIEASRKTLLPGVIVGSLRGARYTVGDDDVKTIGGKKVIQGAGKGALIGAGTGLGAAALYTGIRNLLRQREENN